MRVKISPTLRLLYGRTEKLFTYWKSKFWNFCLVRAWDITECTDRIWSTSEMPPIKKPQPPCIRQLSINKTRWILKSNKLLPSMSGYGFFCIVRSLWKTRWRVPNGFVVTIGNEITNKGPPVEKYLYHMWNDMNLFHVHVWLHEEGDNSIMHGFKFKCITLLWAITLFCRTDNIMWNILHIYTEFEEYCVGLASFCGIFFTFSLIMRNILQNIVSPT